MERCGELLNVVEGCGMLWNVVKKTNSLKYNF